ncbi:ABC transporter permease [Plasticicumulans sp.]|uniref:ABC transporter permease n=1 Tax=Plasticicumulans sp. TaxID=2307179 RepID=UPI000FA0D7E5|nr:ABC transporter permease [Plasticicumulans sp.]RTL04158.1 MAG: ABC transporter permease [Xanthomonadales bacterium]HMV39307.1 ABC transporter permease [Plasticicumulans sp.]HMW30062.1 ABC transporter permease [Plasticicumulans sp.]HMZ09624.1 ABC transporter permease [Plasticicumulans sp.]HNB89106.1 ABC transporter permease [Plasticicumulans sp.]
MSEQTLVLPAPPLPRRAAPSFEAWSLRCVFGVLAALALVFLVAPTLVILLTSFTATESLRFPPEGFSLRWYAALLDADQMQAAAWNSLVVALWTTVLCVLLGTPAAIAIARSKSPWVRACDVLFMSPLLLPALAFGFAALIFIHRLGLRPDLPLLVLGHVIVCTPFVLRTTIAALTQLEPSLLDASRSLGASEWTTFRRVTLPLIARGIGAGAFLAFMASFDNVPVSLFLADERTEVLPIHLWQQIENNLDVRTAAASGLIVLLTLTLMVIAERTAGLTRQMR